MPKDDPPVPSLAPVRGSQASETPIPAVWDEATFSLRGRADTVPLPRPAAEVGRTLGRCQLTGVLGRGASATVFRASHRTLRMPVAVKVPNREAGGIHPDVIDELRVEAELLSACSHPNLVRVYDLDDNPDLPYLVLELVDGPSLKDAIRRGHGLPPPRAREVVLQVLDALEALWAAGVVHRDVKPGNVLLAADGTAKLADLGQAVRVVDGRPDPSRPAAVAGTAAYLAPEQFLTPAAVDHRADIYALGTTMYEAVTGRLPFPGRSRLDVLMKHVLQPPEPPDGRVAGLDPAWSRVILTMMAKDAADRFQDAAALRTALTAIGLPPPQERRRSWWSRLRSGGRSA